MNEYLKDLSEYLYLYPSRDSSFTGRARRLIVVVVVSVHEDRGRFVMSVSEIHNLRKESTVYRYVVVSLA